MRKPVKKTFGRSPAIAVLSDVKKLNKKPKAPAMTTHTFVVKVKSRSDEPPAHVLKSVRGCLSFPATPREMRYDFTQPVRVTVLHKEA